MHNCVWAVFATLGQHVVRAIQIDRSAFLLCAQPKGGTMSMLPTTTNRRRLTVLGAAAALVGGGVVVGNLAGAASGPSAADYAQCANNGFVANVAQPTDCPGGWINGILNASNSQYHEDQSTAQRMMVGFPDTASGNHYHSVTIKYMDRKASTHAYDYLTSVDFTQT